MSKSLKDDSEKSAFRLKNTHDKPDLLVAKPRMFSCCPCAKKESIYAPRVVVVDYADGKPKVKYYG